MSDLNNILKATLRIFSNFVSEYLPLNFYFWGFSFINKRYWAIKDPKMQNFHVFLFYLNIPKQDFYLYKPISSSFIRYSARFYILEMLCLLKWKTMKGFAFNLFPISLLKGTFPTTPQISWLLKISSFWSKYQYEHHHHLMKKVFRRMVSELTNFPL